MKKIILLNAMVLCCALGVNAQSSYIPNKTLVTRANIVKLAENNKEVIQQINSEYIKQQYKPGLKKFGSNVDIEKYYPQTDDNTFNKTILLNPDNQILVFHFINSAKRNMDSELEMLHKVTENNSNVEIVLVDYQEEPKLFDDLKITTNPTTLFYVGKQFKLKKVIMINPYEFEDTFNELKNL